MTKKVETVLLPMSRKEMLDTERNVWAKALLDLYPGNVSLVKPSDFKMTTWKPDIVYKIERLDETIFIPVKYHCMNSTGGVIPKFIQLATDMLRLHFFNKCKDVVVYPMMSFIGDGAKPLTKIFIDRTRTKTVGIVKGGFYVDRAIMEYMKTGDKSGFFNHNFIE